MNRTKHKKKIVKKYHHSSSRIKERYGIDLSEEEYRKISNSIRFLKEDCKKRHYKVELMEKKSNTRSIYKVYYNDIVLIVVYDKTRGCVETFLPLNCKEHKRYERNKKENE